MEISYIILCRFESGSWQRLYMKESDFVRIINNSIKAAGGFSYKIPDTPFIPNNPMRFTGKKPFDIIAFLWFDVWVIEVKFSRGINGFSGKILRPHQEESLTQIDKIALPGKTHSVVIYGCYSPRKIKRIYIFDIWYVVRNRITKLMLIKELPFMKIKKGLFDATQMEEYIIK